MEQSQNSKEGENIASLEDHPRNADVEREVKSDHKLCRSCFEEIDVSATVCQHCGQRQGFLGQHFGHISVGISGVAIVVSIVMMVLAIAQYFEARKQRIDASEAARKANLALTQAKSDANEIKDLKIQADKLNTLLEESTKVTSELVGIQRKSILLNEFMMTIIRAQNDDRQAYDQLAAVENDTQSPFQQQALIAKMNIRLLYAERLGSRGGVKSIAPFWTEGVDPNMLTISQLIEAYNESPWHFRSGLVTYIWERDDLSKKDRMQFLIDTLKNERNLKAVCIAQHWLSKEANIKFNPFVIEPLVEWWEQNKADYDENTQNKNGLPGT